MKFDHVVKHDGIYYETGQEVPIGEPPVLTEEKEQEQEQETFIQTEDEQPLTDSDINFESAPHMYTYEELKEISVREIRKIAEDLGFEITKTIKDDVINEFLSKQ